ncbi:hypothetical protein HG717_15900 [Rhodococcus erythropolis]|uniref:hypothetical protein n=1 Tax=Rhodococcus erythropolis TaxID=1833 RepID=UPI001C9ACE2C|nr:hypothetical protein [Rhodococcus erythropolis]MBY6385385.1 hypothetical protein [Rhodococcus erythropolis]
MDFVVRPVSTLPKSTARVVESNNWRLHDGYPAVDWLLVAHLSAVVVQERASDCDYDDWMHCGDEGGLFGPDLRAWGELFTQPLEIGSERTWVNGRHRATQIAAPGARHVAVADPQWRPSWA